MKASVFKTHERLQACPPALFIYIVYRRLVEQGIRTSWLWVKDKLVRRIRGYSPPELSQVTDLLFVGGQHRHHGLQAMRELGIRAIVNMRQEWDDAAHGLALDAYLWLPVIDDTEPTLEQLTRGADFIHQQVEQGHGVYIHCAAGVGRAPTMAVAYLIYTGDPVERAWERVCQRRPFVRPTPPQQAITRAFAEKVRARQRLHPSPLGRQVSAGQEETRSNEEDLHDWLQRILEQLAEDPKITDPLPDAAAQTLLAWAQEQLIQLWNREKDHGMPASRPGLGSEVQALRHRMQHLTALVATSEDPAATLREILRSEHGGNVAKASPTAHAEALE